VFTSHWSQLSQGGWKESGEKEARAQQVEAVQRKVLADGSLKKTLCHFQQSGGQVNTYVQDTLGTSLRRPREIDKFANLLVVTDYTEEDSAP